jgi:hypothetical protein
VRLKIASGFVAKCPLGMGYEVYGDVEVTEGRDETVDRSLGVQIAHEPDCQAVDNA